MYYPYMHDKEFSLYHKVEIAYFWRSFLQMITKMYSVHVMFDQNAFIKEALEDEEKYQGEITTLHKIIELIKRPELPPENKSKAEDMSSAKPSDLLFGKYGQKEMAMKLRGGSLVEMQAGDIPLTSTQFLSGEVKISWYGKQGALIYLFYLLNGKSRELPSERLTTFVSKRFKILVAGLFLEVTATQLSKTLYNIESKYITHGHHKPKYLLEIEEIAASVISTE